MDKVLEEALKGDRDAFSLIFLQIQKDLYRIALSKTGNKEDSLDAIQETMYYTYKNLHQLKSKDSLKYWIIKVLINECYKIYNKKNKINLIPIENSEKYEDKEFYEKDIDSNIKFKELLACLKNREKIIMILYYENLYTTKEIAKIMKIKENTIKSIIKRSKNKIKKDLEENNYEKFNK